jgi:hypothetical protein
MSVSRKKYITSIVLAIIIFIAPYVVDSFFKDPWGLIVAYINYYLFVVIVGATLFNVTIGFIKFRYTETYFYIISYILGILQAYYFFLNLGNHLSNYLYVGGVVLISIVMIVSTYFRRKKHRVSNSNVQ